MTITENHRCVVFGTRAEKAHIFENKGKLTVFNPSDIYPFFSILYVTHNNNNIICFFKHTLQRIC